MIKNNTTAVIGFLLVVAGLLLFIYVLLKTLLYMMATLVSFVMMVYGNALYTNQPVQNVVRFMYRNKSK